MASIESVRMVLIASVGRSVLIVERTLSWCVGLLRCLAMWRGFLVLLIACGGSTPATLPVEAPSPRPAPPAVAATSPSCTNAKPDAPDALVVPVASTFTVPDSHEVEWFAPAWKKVGLGQTISFGTSAIDQDLDETRVDVTRMPFSARFDPITQTVVWTPAIGDMPKAEFEVTITQP